jgi:uncharacterized protein (DUF1778 family)
MAKTKKRQTSKNDRFNFRVSTAEKERLIEVAQSEGFDSLSAWVLWLARRREKELYGQPNGP